MKPKILLLLFFLFVISVNAQQNRNLEKTITALNNQDEKTINNLILKDFGLAIITRPGSTDILTIIDQLSFENPIPEYLPYSSFGTVNPNLKIKFKKSLDYECNIIDSEFKMKKGIYVSPISSYYDLSRTAKLQNDSFDEVWSLDEIKKMKEIENNSQKIIAYSEEGIYVFYLTLINEKWYLTMLHRLQCDA